MKNRRTWVIKLKLFLNFLGSIENNSYSFIYDSIFESYPQAIEAFTLTQ
jgi:hypothetical protein